jgi:periplasmic protein TonB
LADPIVNPRPTYPAMSRRLAEQGKVLVRVWVDADGRAMRAELQQSSGFERLDRAAQQTVLRWRYSPGQRAGVPEPMWVDVPVNFVLE